MMFEINLNNLIKIDLNSIILIVVEVGVIILIFLVIRFFFGKVYK